ncbi:MULTISPECIES: RagB/SusD family nutrient uptake outer membrane protein [Sphingobacterium]|uniref:RagB/SusD family nutrient uptake outer membrane protein n=1 Tax=Sphingobacterium TaxID=28453 RepID=UPI00257E5A97|nr:MULTISPECIES: RagB/SusD family nutrient uptake outer membrane protein [Sphingobacterium]
MKTLFIINYWKLVLLLAIGLSCVSCNKFLEEEPRNSTYKEVYWKDPKAGESAIAGNYALLRNALMDGFYGVGNRYYIYGDMTPDIYIGINRDSYSHPEIGKGNWTSNYFAQSYGNWTVFYKTIAMSNIILKEMPLVPNDILILEQTDPEAFRKKIMGQAYFIRAFSYFMLTRIWGDVPLVTEAYDDPINAPHLGRTPRIAVMKQIEEDCRHAIGLLSWGYKTTAERAVTANRGSAYALMAHLYLWRATTADLASNTPIMDDVTRADTTINTLLAQGGYTLADTAKYADVFKGRSSEGIFELNVSENTLEGSSAHIGMKFLNSDYIPTYAATADFFTKPAYLSSHFYKIEEKEDWVWHEDIRQWVWETVQSRGLDTLDVRFKNNFVNYTSDKPVCIKYSNIVFRNPGQQLEPYNSNNLILFRLSDIKLLQAEIALYQNNPGRAITIINASRARYGADPSSLLKPSLTKTEVMKEYMIERGKELYLEGHLFFDMIRTRTYSDHITWLSEARFKQGGFFWPVDPRLFSENRLLVQTAYWRGKI